TGRVSVDRLSMGKQVTVCRNECQSPHHGPGASLASGADWFVDRSRTVRSAIPSTGLVVGYRGTRITDDGLAHLKGLKNLDSLTLPIAIPAPASPRVKSRHGREAAKTARTDLLHA